VVSSTKGDSEAYQRRKTVAPPGKGIELGFTLRLLDDFGKSCEGMNGPDAQFWRRNAVRSLFGFLEAWMSVSRNHMVPDILRSHGDQLLKTDEDRAYISGLLAATDSHEWLLNDKGEGERHKRKLKFLPLLKASFRLILFVGGVSKDGLAQIFSSSDWQKLREAVKVRDRLMHPHVHDDIFVTDEEVMCIQAVTNLMCGMWSRLKLPKCPAVYNDE
jgi:hypothetical protein